MRYTNLSNLPAPLVSAIMFDDYDKGDADISVSGLVEPVRMHVLKERHNDEIVEDVSEGIWRLIGSVGHKILERSNTDNHLAEERLYTKVLGWTISGKADLLGPDMVLDDYKFTSVYAMKGLKPEYEQQTNLYDLLYRANGFQAKKLRIIAILRDWSKPKAAREGGDYPKVGVVVKEVPQWTPEEQEAFLASRVACHQAVKDLPDNALPMCTDEERWKRPDVYAVKKKGNKRATKLFETEHDAVEMVRSFNKDLIVEHRPATYPRCELYCPVKQFCSFGKTLEAPAETEAA